MSSYEIVFQPSGKRGRCQVDQSLLEAAGQIGLDLVSVCGSGALDAMAELHLAGVIDVSSAITIGMLPSLPLERFQQVGNAAGTGARLALISLSKRVEAQTIADRVRYIELRTAPGFQDLFIRATRLLSST
jgi:uncharacterized 2Fe-2S/4Fe-4S cluster protein (DUF4445 family)